MIRKPAIVVTRPEPECARTVRYLTERGLDSIERPLLEVRSIDVSSDEIARLFASDWILVTSRNAARTLAALVMPGTHGAADDPPFAIAAIHQGTADALARAGIPAARVLDARSASEAASRLLRSVPERPLRIGYPCSRQADTDDRFSALAGPDVSIEPVPLYETVPADEPGDESGRAFWHGRDFDAVLVASPTAVRALHAIRPVESFPSDVAFAALGRTTGAELSRHGRPPSIVPPEPTLAALADALLHWRETRSPE